MRAENNGKPSILSDFIVVKALENGVSVIGMTRGQETKFAHSEKLDAGEVWIAQFTEFTSAMKIRGKALILTAHGAVESGKRNEETS
ncbi:MAG TPA: trp RNA-binding attenuation protein MtrB [Synergistaceae bacterium]|jgi:transcription attenuation protein (tryptophan RNA-binding attenuator protein)|nr:MAG: Tryptophan RNA-binding attenuator protein [Synergistales bacterium 57_84]KUK88515.1 MAG: Tryptophan RNA-binding attenuator protein [Synergistales bacterium 58_81]HBG14909.1 trp RNA-binding attenuation protein MtrB [Synergistaceae bacterium]HCP07863.1 trp RNA-binding attenuation protein MtrB [Synergistaceae bacterium]HCR38548.1 trp RNA-binding attenuation protein MtrB [Synergistaceae bacterium]